MSTPRGEKLDEGISGLDAKQKHFYAFKQNFIWRIKLKWGRRPGGGILEKDFFTCHLKFLSSSSTKLSLEINIISLMFYFIGSI